MKAYTKESVFGEYESACERFEELVGKLSSPASQSLEHGEVELLIKFDSMEILRLLMQGYLDQRAAGEERVEVCLGADGHERSHCRKRCRSLETIFGKVQVHRLGYSETELDSVFLLDAALNLPLDKYSHGLRRKVALEAAKGSFEETIAAIKENTGANIAKRQSEEVAQAVSADFNAYYENNSPESKINTELLVMTTDGKGVVMRKEDLRPATRKAAEASKHKLKTRLSRGEKRNRKRMATVASVYETTLHQRTAEQIMGVDGQEASARPQIFNKRVWASLRQKPSDVIEDMFAEAERRDPDHHKQWLVLVDGQEAQLEEVKTAIGRHRNDVIVIQDFVHVLEYLWKAAYCFYDSGTEEAETWVMEHALSLLNGKISDTAAGMRRSATWRNLSQEERKPVDKCAGYLIKNKNRFDYATALVNGWPIATGVIEGACRYLVKDRMELSGARWSLNGAEAVLRLRALRSSGDFDDYMEFHQGQEYQRNHAPTLQCNEYRKAA